MKKIILILTLILLSCSSTDDNTKKEMPSKFDIEVEIKGLYNTDVLIAVNGIVVKRWDNTALPFNTNYTYLTSGDEVTNVETVCNCITISAWAYLDPLNELEEFSMYVDGNLIETKTVSDPPVNGVKDPTTIDFIYKL